ncbi:MAG: hypothetical protein TR69_WS6001000521 [candidate division WS6 bacterium OLB20]|uniref:Uncharacterized protein n=1 Tax=candidate division WS6 bacterium OLB20 TaxID=1617426 RepID=A0A136LY45_9BACT|nr:MAG: hypothetical protein TR69_WS6001000521 [candidate division WS6 bacterium OLB20]
MLLDFHRNRTRLAVFLTVVTLTTLAIIPAVKFVGPDDLPAPAATETLVFEWENLPTLRLGHYALWAQHDDTTALLKRFNRSGDTLVSLNGEPLTTWQVSVPAGSTELFVTIEAEGDRDENPNLEMMRAPITGDTAVMKFTDMTEAAGSVILATPTDGNSQINERSGFWFTGPQAQQTSLTLPELPDGFRWQSRVTNSSVEVTTGMFETAAGPDDLSKYSETGAPGFSFPGEDMLQNLPEGLLPPLNLANGTYTIIVSAEPYSSGDFTGETVFVVVLAVTVPDTAEARSGIELVNTARVPALTIRIE